MKYFIAGFLAICALVGTSVILYRRFFARITSADPQVWEKAIRAFEAADRRTTPPEHPIVFT